MRDFEVTEKIFEQFRTVTDQKGNLRYCLFDVVQLLVGDDDISQEWETIIASDSFLYSLGWQQFPVKDWVFDYFTDLECIEEPDIYRVIQYMPTENGELLRLWLAERETPYPFRPQRIFNRDVIKHFGLNRPQPIHVRHYADGLASIQRSSLKGGLTFEETVCWLNEFHQGLFAGRAAFQAGPKRPLRSIRAINHARTNIELALISVGMAVVEEERLLDPPENFADHLAIARKGANAVESLYENYCMLLERPL